MSKKIKSLITIIVAMAFTLSESTTTIRAQENKTEIKMSGMYSYMADAAIFKDCKNGTKYPVAFEADHISLERAYLQTNHSVGKPLKVNLIGEITKQDGMDNQKDIPTLIVKKFLNIIPKESCQNPHSVANLENTYWKVTVVGDKAVALSKRREAHMILSGGIIKGNSGCNGLGGAYKLDDDKLSFSDKGFMSTMMFCEGSIEVEFLKALKKMYRYEIKGEYLEVFDKDDARLIRFESVYL